jgi:antitoxin component YwqK of YwqJK toxin-antitoxin module
MKYYEGDTLLRYKGRFVNNQPVDTFYYFYPTGELQSALFHRKDGYVLSTSYYAEGTLLAKGRYYKQQKDSSWSYYGESGNLLSTEFYIEGKKYGLWKVFHDNGNLAAEKIFENNLENGPHKQYYRDGTLFREINFKQGSIEGHGIYYHENGQPSMEGEYYHDAKQGAWKEYDEEGKLIREVKYNKGVPEGGLPMIEADSSGYYRKDKLDESDFLPEDEYAPQETETNEKRNRQ